MSIQLAHGADCVCGCGCEYLFCTLHPYRRGDAIYCARSTHPGAPSPDGFGDPFWDSVHLSIAESESPTYPMGFLNWVDSPHWWLSCWVPVAGGTLETDPPFGCVSDGGDPPQCEPDPLGGHWDHECDECGLVEGADTPENCHVVGGSAPMVSELILHPIP